MMKIKLSILILSGLLFFPSIALASWWNPFSWFGNDTTVSEPTPLIQDSENLIDEDSYTEETQETPNDVVSSTQEVQRTVTSRDYDNEISQLRQEIQSLRSDLSNLQRSYNSLLSLIEDQTNISSQQVSNSRVDDLEKRVGDISNKLNQVDTDKIDGRLSELENRPSPKNYDEQISEIAKRINAIMRAGVSSSVLSCGHLAVEPIREGRSGPSCHSIFGDLDY